MSVEMIAPITIIIFRVLFEGRKDSAPMIGSAGVFILVLDRACYPIGIAVLAQSLDRLEDSSSKKAMARSPSRAGLRRGMLVPGMYGSLGSRRMYCSLNVVRPTLMMPFLP
jgi:hypothetical protein